MACPSLPYLKVKGARMNIALTYETVLPIFFLTKTEQPSCAAFAGEIILLDSGGNDINSVKYNAAPLLGFNLRVIF